MEHGKFLIIAVTWFILVASNTVFYFFNRNTLLKRRLHPWILWSIGVILAVLTLWLQRDRLSGTLILSVVIPTIAITLYNIKAIVFCDACGMTSFLLIPLKVRGRCVSCKGEITVE